jgi:phosphatidate cytidylyltransferase
VLKTRVVTGLSLAALVLGILFAAPPVAGALFIGAATLIGFTEWAQFAGWQRAAGRLAYAGAGLVAGAYAWLASAEIAWRQGLMALAAVFWVLCFLWLVLAPGRVGRVAALLAGFWVLIPAAVGIGRLLLGAGRIPGTLLLLFMIVIVAAADIGAYFTGRAFGRHRLAPRVSPNKTWEGLAGGLVLAAVVGAGGAALLHLATPGAVTLSLVVALASVVGDLTESMMKRAVGLKDSGRLLPGHGGVLDRLDSITAAVPFYLLGLGWLGGLA